MASRGPDPKATDEELVESIVSAENPFVTAGDVASDVSLSSERARQRLNQLEEDERIARAKVGGSAVVYWISDSESGSK